MDYGSKKGSAPKSGAGTTTGLSKHEKFKPHDSAPPESNVGGRPRHDNSMINRSVDRTKT